MNKYSAYFALAKDVKRYCQLPPRADLIAAFTDGAKESLKELSATEYREFIVWIKLTYKDSNQYAKNASKANRMRRKIIALFIHQMDYTMTSLNGWCKKYGKYNKVLNDHTVWELPYLVSQAENVYASHIKNIL